MRKTPFAGLTVLQPGESQSSDGFSFQSRNPYVIDQLLRVGAVTHRHDDHPSLDDPTEVPGVSDDITGGSLPAGVSYYVGYTLVDDSGGETKLSPVGVTTTAPPMAAPVNGPTLELESATGSLRAGLYSYVVTLTDDRGGETLSSPPVTIERPFGPANGSIVISGLAAMLSAAGADRWRVYKAAGSGLYHYIADGTDDVLIDDGSLCADCAGHPPQRNSTRQANILRVTVPAHEGVNAFRLYVSPDGNFNGTYMGEWPMSEAGTPIDFATLVAADQAPPDRSLVMPGAHKIDPATEIATADGSVWAALGAGGGGGGWRARGPWDDSLSYSLGDLVEHNGALWLAQLTSDDEPGVDASGLDDYGTEKVYLRAVSGLNPPQTLTAQDSTYEEDRPHHIYVIDVTTPGQVTVDIEGDFDPAGMSFTLGEATIVGDPQHGGPWDMPTGRIFLTVRMQDHGPDTTYQVRLTPSSGLVLDDTASPTLVRHQWRKVVELPASGGGGGGGGGGAVAYRYESLQSESATATQIGASGWYSPTTEDVLEIAPPGPSLARIYARAWAETAIIARLSIDEGLAYDELYTTPPITLMAGNQFIYLEEAELSSSQRPWPQFRRPLELTVGENAGPIRVRWEYQDQSVSATVMLRTIVVEFVPYTL
jgi:hypothetical protein